MTDSRCVNQDDIRKFAELTGDFNKLHFDDEFAKSTMFRGRVAHGLLTLSIASGLWYGLNATNDSTLSFLGINNLSFKVPVYPGDNLHLVSEVVSRRDSSSGRDAGVVGSRNQVVNDRNEVVLQFESLFLVKKKSETQKQ